MGTQRASRLGRPGGLATVAAQALPVLLSLLLYLLPSARAARPFPFYFDVGGISPAERAALHPPVPRVAFGMVFECPHPCGLVAHFATATRDNGTSYVTAVNGGIPQEMNMTLHFATLRATFDEHIALNESRLMDFDFESWNPIWARNPNGSHVRNASLARVRKLHPEWTMTQVEAAAEREFESAAKTVLMETMAYMRELRPAMRVGMYGLPTRFYYHGYNSSSGDVLREQNDNLFPLWCAMDAIFPSVYQFYNSCNRTSARASNELYVRSNVREAVRIAGEAAKRCSPSPSGLSTRPPVLVYTWHRYHDGVSFVCDDDERMAWTLSAEEGSDGIVLWGDERKTAAQFDSYWTNDFAPMALAWTPSEN